LASGEALNTKSEKEIPDQWGGFREGTSNAFGKVPRRKTGKGKGPSAEDRETLTTWLLKGHRVGLGGRKQFAETQEKKRDKKRKTNTQNRQLG